MHLTNSEPNRNSQHEKHVAVDQDFDRATHRIAEQFALTLPHAREVARLSGLGDYEGARR